MPSHLWRRADLALPKLPFSVKLAMPENSLALHPAVEECFFDIQNVEDAASSCGSPSSSITSESASDSWPPELNFCNEKLQFEGVSTQSDGVFGVVNDANMDCSRVFTASDFGPKIPSSMKVRNSNGRHYTEAFEKAPLLGVAQNGCSVSSRDLLVPMKWRAPDSQFRGFKPDVLNKKACHTNVGLVNHLEVSSEQRPCHCGDLQNDYSANPPKSLPIRSIYGLGSNDDSAGHTCNSTEPEKKESGLRYEAVAVKQEDGILSGHACTHLLAWFAGFAIRTFRSQWGFFFHMVFTLILAWYHAFLFAVNPLGYIMRARAKAREASRRKKSDTVKTGLNLRNRALAVQPTVAKGARKLTFGCLTALYTTSLLFCLFVASFILSFIVVKGLVYEPVQLYQYLFFDYTKQSPVALINFSDSVMHSDMGSVLKRLAHPTRNFHATVYLTVPESDFNKKLGIFQVWSIL